MLTLLLAVAAHAQCAPPTCIPPDLNDDPYFAAYAREIDGFGDPPAVPPLIPQLWDGTVSIKSLAGRRLGDVKTVALGNATYVERWVWTLPGGDLTAQDGFSLTVNAADPTWATLMNGYMSKPGWESIAYVEQTLTYKDPPTEDLIDGMVVYGNPDLTLTTYEMYQPGTPTPVGYMIRERRPMGGDVEWVDHWVFDGWTLVGMNNTTTGTVVEAPMQYTSVKGFLYAMLPKDASLYARSTYVMGTLGEDAP